VEGGGKGGRSLVAMLEIPFAIAYQAGKLTRQVSISYLQAGGVLGEQ